MTNFYSIFKCLKNNFLPHIIIFNMLFVHYHHHHLYSKNIFLQSLILKKNLDINCFKFLSALREAHVFGWRLVYKSEIACSEPTCSVLNHSEAGSKQRSSIGSDKALSPPKSSLISSSRVPAHRVPIIHCKIHTHVCTLT